MSPVQRVALAGASGSLGKPVLQAFLDAKKYEVTVFTRPNSSHQFPSGVKVVSVDYENVESVTKALQGQDALVITLGAPGLAVQKNLIDAAVASGVRRIIPSEFGSDASHPANRALPVYQPKVQIADYLEEKTKGTPTSYTFIYNNAFLDWGLNAGFLLDSKGKKGLRYDDGETKTTFTPLSFVAKGTVATLEHLDETANRVVKLHGTSLSFNQLLALVQDVVGKDGWDISQISAADAEKRSLENFKKDPSNFPAWGFDQLGVAVYGKGRGGDFSKENDNALLGLKELSSEEVKQVVKSSV